MMWAKPKELAAITVKNENIGQKIYLRQLENLVLH